MSVKLERWVDGAIGETREALAHDGRVIALRVMRWSDEGKRARWGEIYRARVLSVDRQRRGTFLDLGLGRQQGFLPLDADGKARTRGGERFELVEGAGVTVSIAREAARAKNPVAELVEFGGEGDTPQRVAQPECDEDLAQARPADSVMRGQLDAAIDDALAKSVSIPGGGALTIEPCAALTAIDVDSGARQGPGDAERFALELNIAAAQETARQVRLRNLGGLIAVDFVSMRSKAHRVRLERVVQAAFADDPWSVQFAPLSRFGVLELSRAQLRAPLHEVMREADGRLSAESVALAALRAIEREARAASGRQIACTVAGDVKAWLDGAEFDWRGEMQNRIGVRWAIEAGVPHWPRERIDSRAV